MLFNSQFFIFIFLPICLLGWYLLNKFKLYRTAMIFLIGMSLWFYGYFNPSYLLIIAGSILGNYLISFLMDKFKKYSKVFLWVGLIGNIGLLAYYKYFDFFLENINVVFRTDFTLKHILLPLGISFFTLQQISYIIDRSWGMAPHYNIIDYAAFVTFFPQLIAGPIVLHNELIPQFQDKALRTFNKTNFRDGVILFILGLIKKVLIADLFGLIVNYGFEKIFYIDMPSAWCIALSYTFELYFDFSGYCDMACGLGKMFNFELPVNFNSPYKSHSVPEYWNRWHFTLTRFFTTYIFTPLTIRGVRRKKKKLYSVITPLIVFFISGLWHGASWTFVLWGIAQGIATVWSYRKFWKLKKTSKLAWCGTFIFAIITQAIFRSETLDNMFRILKGMFIPKYTGFMIDLASSLINNKIIKSGIVLLTPHVSAQTVNWTFFALMIVFFVVAVIILKGKNAHRILALQKEKGPTVGFTICLSLLFVWSLISLTEVSTFLYFNF